MTTDCATVAPEEKVYVYHGLEYRFSVREMAAQTDVSVRTIKTYLKLRAMGYESHMIAGWTAAQCYAHAGRPKRKPAPTKAEIIYLRGEVADAVDEIKRLREMLFDLGVDPNG